jgi:hypothetical protein
MTDMSVIDGPLIYFDHGDLEALESIGFRLADRSDFFAEIRREGYAQLFKAAALNSMASTPADVAAAVKKSRRHRLPRMSVPDGLRTSSEAAARLCCSIKTLNGYVAAGAIGYVIIGHGTKRPRKMFTDADINAFIAAQTRTEIPCRSIGSRVHRTGTSNSKSTVVAFTAAPKPRSGATPKK